MKKPGEFQKKRAIRQRQAKIYNKLNAACDLAMETGSAVVEVDNRRFYLSNTPTINSYMGYLAMIRLKKRGVVYAQVYENKNGRIDGIYPYEFSIDGIHGFLDKQLAAYVDRVETITLNE